MTVLYEAPILGPLNVVAPQEVLRYNHAVLYKTWFNSQVLKWDYQALRDRINGNDESYRFILVTGDDETVYLQMSDFIPLRHHYDYWRSVRYVNFSGSEFGPKGSETRRVTELSLRIRLEKNFAEYFKESPK